MAGRIEVITGPMFSGKTEEMTRRIRRAMYGKYRIQAFQPLANTRLERSAVTMMPTTVHVLNTGANLYDAVAPDIHVIAIDEVQFFQDLEFVDQIERLANRGVTTILAGLDTDYLGKPFGLMPNLMAIADEVLKLTAVCMKCHREPGTKTWRRPSATSRAQILVGDTDMYEARCRGCFSEAT